MSTISGEVIMAPKLKSKRIVLVRQVRGEQDEKSKLMLRIKVLEARIKVLESAALKTKKKPCSNVVMELRRVDRDVLSSLEVRRRLTESHLPPLPSFP